MRKNTRLGGLYVLLSSLTIARAAIEGGADMIQFRCKDGFSSDQLEIAHTIRALCRKAQVIFIINDSIDVTLELDADGVHLGQADHPIPDARKLLGPHHLIGGTACTVKQALEVQSAGADYVGFGHIFPTLSKKKDYPPLGVEPIRDAKKVLKIPLLAIGGIDHHNAPDVLAAGADGIAVIRAIGLAEDPIKATQRMKRCFVEHRN